jgi:hypothetical protein
MMKIFRTYGHNNQLSRKDSLQMKKSMHAIQAGQGNWLGLAIMQMAAIVTLQLSDEMPGHP